LQPFENKNVAICGRTIKCKIAALLPFWCVKTENMRTQFPAAKNEPKDALCCIHH